MRGIHVIEERLDRMFANKQPYEFFLGVVVSHLIVA